MKLNTNEEVKAVLERLDGKDFTVEKVEKKERRRNAPLPYTTSSMQMDAANKINFRTRKTMMVAQQLHRRNQYRLWCSRFDYLYAYRLHTDQSGCAK